MLSWSMSVKDRLDSNECYKPSLLKGRLLRVGGVGCYLSIAQVEILRES